MTDRARQILECPSYTTAEAARYLFLPVATLRSWVAGRHYPTTSGTRRFQPILRVAPGAPTLLSFVNLVEAHVLAAIRRDHGIRLDKVRKALAWLERSGASRHPLADHELLTDNLDLFLEQYGDLINVSQDGQIEMKKVVLAYLRRIERNPKGVPIRLYPFIRHRGDEDPRPIVIDPAVSFGRPVLAGTGIPTEVIAERFDAGEAIEELASDYGRSREEIEEAIRFERHATAA